MEQTIYILVVEDEPEVLDAIVLDLEMFEKKFPIEMASSAEEAREIINEVLEAGDRFGLFLCDHVLPEENGVDLMIDLQIKEATADARKVLITGQAGLNETVKAVNSAELNHYIAKPWDEKELQDVVRHQLTEYVIDKVDNMLPYMDILETDRLAEAIRSGKGITDH